MNRRLIATATAAVLAIGIVAAPVAARPSAGPNSIAGIATAVNADSGEFSILLAALGAADPSIVAKLSSKGGYTVFAPTDAAFLRLLDTLDLTAGELLANKSLLNSVLLYHVAPGVRDSGDVFGSTRIKTLNGAFIRVSGGQLIDGSSATPNANPVVGLYDIPASNGIIHVIDQVLVP